MSSGSLSLSPGDRLGRYQIVALLGSGGMGEVYRARDPELKRDVAIKVLRRAVASPEDLARFSREARAAGSLNHANIVVVYDVGVEAGVPYVVTELLDGETLRARLDRGSIPFLKAVEYGSQIADALGAAHARGIWHRDVKPANAFITSEGRVKLLDFGIAKLGERHLHADANDPTEEVSDKHAVLGTAGYMSPEQVLGQPADHRSDIFALGAVLYEMFTRTRAFKRGSTVETMTAVLQDDPVDPLTIKPDLPPQAVAIVRRCLEKNREERFQSARDLAFDLQQLRDVSTTTRPLVGPTPGRRRRWLQALSVATLVLSAAGLGFLLARPPEPPAFEQLTFRRTRVGGARFVPDSGAIVYSEAREGNRLEVWQLEPGANSPPRLLAHGVGTDLLAAGKAELALLVDRQFLMGERFVGTLAVGPPDGVAPRLLEKDIEDADWDPAHTQLALVRSRGGVAGRSSLEYPSGTTRYEAEAGSIGCPRVSRDGRYIAFLEDSVGAAEGGQVMLFSLQTGQATALTAPWRSVRGLAWSQDGREIWFTAGDSFSNRAVRAVTIDGRQRVVMSAPGSLTLWDIAADGRVLLSRDDERRSLVGVSPGGTTEREMSLFDDSGLADLSNDGRLLLFTDRFGVYLAPTDGSLPTRPSLRDAYADDLSPDGLKVLATARTGSELMVLHTAAVPSQTLPAHSIKQYRGARWFPDGQRILFSGLEQDRALRSYVQDPGGGSPTPLTPEHIWGLAISPDGTQVAAIGDDQPYISIFPVAGGEPQRVAGSEHGDRPVAWSADGKSLWIFRRGEVPAQVIRLDIATGRRHIARTLLSGDTAGVNSITELAITPDGRAYFYSYRRLLSQLYLVRGLE